jgi:pimeloyl-ACP methyl ester carboxylesterase
MPKRTIAGAAGVRIAVYDGGTSAAPPLLFIHGCSQSHRSWSRQFDSPLAARFRLAAFDLRGHGDSDKPAGAYGDSRLWAEDVHAVITALGLEKPLLVCWSYAGVVACDYLRVFGEDAISGLVLVGAMSKVGAGLMPHLGEDLPPLLGGWLSDDPALARPAGEAFVRLCFEKDLGADAYDETVAYNALVPGHVRAAMLSREVDNDDILAGLRKPVLILHGERDRVIKPTFAAEHARTMPRAASVLFPGLGHSPFFEDAEAFNGELISFHLSRVGEIANDDPLY